MVALIFGVTFTIRNPQVVDLSYYFGIQWQGPLSWLVIIVFLIGVVTGLMTSYIFFLKRKIFHHRRKTDPQNES